MLTHRVKQVVESADGNEGRQQREARVTTDSLAESCLSTLPYKPNGTTGRRESQKTGSLGGRVETEERRERTFELTMKPAAIGSHLPRARGGTRT